MKELFKKILSVLMVIILSPFLILAGICLIFLVPFDYIKYKTSLYYKMERKKYSLYDGTSENFKIYNEIVKNNLPIRYISNPQNRSLASGWFVFEKTLIIIGFSTFEYDYEKHKWFWDGESEEITLEEYMEMELQEYNKNAGTTECDKAVVLISEDDVHDLGIAVKEERFLLYKKDRGEKMKKFCESKLLQTQDLIIKKGEQKDWKDMYYNLWRHSESAKYMLWNVTTSEEDAQDRMARTVKFEETHPYCWLVYEKASGQAIGFAGMEEIEPGVFEDMGVALGPDFVGKGYGKQIINAMADYAKINLGAHKMLLSYREGNVASKRLQEACGFSYSHSVDKDDPRTGEMYVLHYTCKML